MWTYGVRAGSLPRICSRHTQELKQRTSHHSFKPAGLQTLLYVFLALPFSFGKQQSWQPRW